jgi:hypothetical protein
VLFKPLIQCGAGNLLIAAAKHLPVRQSVTDTLNEWGRHLAGFDIHSEFIAATHVRLALLAVSRGAEFDLPPRTRLAHFFPFIRRGDGLRELNSLSSLTHIIVNPPFGLVTVGKNCSWAQGKVTKAAVFFQKCLKTLPHSISVSAILPDVLRSGSRYQRWRKLIEKHATIEEVAPVGNFETADVDVFILRQKTQERISLGGAMVSGGERPAPTRLKERISRCVLGRLFLTVSNAMKRQPRSYVHAKGLPFWGVFRPKTETVKFAGTVVRPPLVVVRRTSSPSDRNRALGTIIIRSGPVAVENHLVVCIPKSGGLAACKRLLKVLQRDATNAFLNRRIRCRHFDGWCRKGNSMVKGNLRFSPDILIRLGEELVPNASDGLLELVKNAYDADASACSINIEKNMIRISDNGDGMTEADIVEGWLLIGGSRKDPQKPTPWPDSSRKQGLAALRLGRRPTLVSRPKSNRGIEHRVTIDWDKVEKGEFVEQEFFDVLSASTTQTKGTEIILEHQSKDRCFPSERAASIRPHRKSMLWWIAGNTFCRIKNSREH